MNQLPQPKYLKDYSAPSHLIESIELTFNINPSQVICSTRTKYRQNGTNSSLTLNGSANLVQILINDQELHHYRLTNDQLTISELPTAFELTIVTELDPFNNKSCMGLYASNGNLFTQCEPEGFRKITYYLDRPDVMAQFTTTIIADPLQYPVLLSNGNLTMEQTIADGRRQVVWCDPFKKPSYLFALVAGRFSKIHDQFITSSGRTITLEVYSEAETIHQCQHCIESLKRAMAWDEQRFALEYDLERYTIVASNDFNMGAMENKGLNIFNTKYVLADKHIATDTDFINVEAVVGHEYFHNWTGNRVTCRDWFQLSLKEGLTVFRDQEFTSDLHSRAVKRIQDVKMLRQAQFPEDASPLAHPVRPESYLEINNFYTMTVYEKGAEVVRMYQTILGKQGFKRGLELYFQRHDGSAATCDDFCQAMADANQVDLNQFMLWYSQAGTPTVIVQDSYDPHSQTYQLQIKQLLPITPDQSNNKQPQLIPIAFGLLDHNGQPQNLEIINGNIIHQDNEAILLLNSEQQTFNFKTPAPVTPSLLRDYSAPVIIDYPYTCEQLILLASHDSNPFVRWESLQTLFKTTIHELYQAPSLTPQLISEQLISALKHILANAELDSMMKSLLLGLPNFAELAPTFKPVAVTKLVAAINFLTKTIADCIQPQLIATYQAEHGIDNSGARALANTCLNYLLRSSNSEQHLTLAVQHYQQAKTMTEKMGAITAVNDSNSNQRQHLLETFVNEYQQHPLALDKWFMLQSQSQNNNTLQSVKQLLAHPNFDPNNPNKLYALIRSFTANHLYFHSHDGYQLVSDEILRIDRFNPGVASRIAHGFSVVTNLTHEHQQQAKPFLIKILSEASLSKDVYELISKTLNNLSTN